MSTKLSAGGARVVLPRFCAGYFTSQGFPVWRQRSGLRHRGLIRHNSCTGRDLKFSFNITPCSAFQAVMRTGAGGGLQSYDYFHLRSPLPERIPFRRHSLSPSCLITIAPSPSSQATDPSWQISGFLITFVNSRFRISSCRRVPRAAALPAHVLTPKVGRSRCGHPDTAAVAQACCSESPGLRGRAKPRCSPPAPALNAFLRCRPGSDSKPAAEGREGPF